MADKDIEIKIKVSQDGTAAKDVKKQLDDLTGSTKTAAVGQAQLATTATNNAQAVGKLSVSQASLSGALNKTSTVANSCNQLFSSQSNILGELSQQVISMVSAYAGIMGIQKVLDILRQAEKAEFALSAAVAAANEEYGNMGSMDEWGQKLDALGKRLKIYADDDLKKAAASVVMLTGELGLNKDQMLELVDISANLSVKSGDLDGTIMKLTGALNGQAKGARTLGVFLKDAAVATKLAALEDSVHFKTLTDKEKVQARYNILVDQTSARMNAASNYATTFNGAMMVNSKAIEESIEKNQALVEVLNQFGQVLVTNKDNLAEMVTGTVKAVATVAKFAIENKNLVLAFAGYKVGAALIGTMVSTAAGLLSAATWVVSFSNAIVMSTSAMIAMRAAQAGLVLGAGDVGIAIGSWLNTFASVRMAAQETFAWIYQGLLNIELGYYRIKAAMVAAYGGDTSGVQARISQIKSEIVINDALIASIYREGGAETQNSNVVSAAGEKIKKAKEARILVDKLSVAALEESAARSKQIYEEDVRTIEAAGLARKDSAESIENQILSLKVDRAKQVFTETTQMLKATQAAEKDAGEAGVAATKKANEEMKKSYLDLQTLKIDALKKYNTAVENTKKLEQDWAAFTTGLQKQLGDAKWADTQVSDNERLAIVYNLQAEAQKKLYEARKLQEIDSVKNQEQIKTLLTAGIALSADAAAKATELGKKEDAAYGVAEQGASDYQDKIKEAIKISEATKTAVVADAKKQEDGFKSAYENVSKAVETAATTMKAAIDDATKDKTVKIDIDKTSLMSELDEIANKIKDICTPRTSIITIQKIETAASGGLMGMFPRRTGYLPGHSSKDDTPAMLMRGEFVQPVHAVQKYGVGFMEAIRTGSLPLNLVPRFAAGGFVEAVQSLFPQYAAGGFVDKKLEEKIRQAEAKIVQFQNAIAQTSGYQLAMPGRVDHYGLNKLDVGKVATAADPKSALTFLGSILENVGSAKDKITKDYSSVIGSATNAGLTDVAKLLQSEMQEIAGLMKKVYETIASLVDDFTALKADFENREKESNTTFKTTKGEIDAKAKEEIQKEIDFQGNVKTNEKEIARWNKEQLKAAGFSDTDITAYFKDKEIKDTDIATIPGKDTIEKKTVYKVRRIGNESTGTAEVMGYYLGNQLVGKTILLGGKAQEVGYVPHGEVTDKGMTLTEEKTGEFYNPAYADLGKKNIADSLGRVAVVKKDQKAAVAAATAALKEELAIVKEDRKASILQLGTDTQDGFSVYRDGLLEEKNTLGIDYTSAIADIQSDMQSATQDLADLKAEWEDEKLAWEEEKKTKSTATLSGSSSGSSGSSSRSVSFFNKGGIAHGEGSGDTVPAMLTPMEGVLNVRAMQALGKERFNMLNNMDFSFLFPKVQHFTSGGIVGDIGNGGGTGVGDMGTINIQFGSHSVAARAPVNTTQDMLRDMKKARMLTCS